VLGVDPHTALPANFDYEARCPACLGVALEVRYRFADFRVLRCHACDLAWRSKMYSPAKIDEIYSADEYAAHPFFSCDQPHAERRSHPRYRHFERALKTLGSRLEPGRLLDVGCGGGTFLWAARDRGWEATGVERSAQLCDVARETSQGATVINAAFEDADLPAGTFDAVTMWDVIEHVRDPAAVVNKLASLLRPGGVLVLCTPDEDSLLTRIGRALYLGSGRRYQYPALALHPTFHTIYFSRASLSGLLRRHGLEPIAAYSQAAFASQSPLASSRQKLAIEAIERVAARTDACWECVLFATTPGLIQADAGADPRVSLRSELIDRR
jgi:SAM-dependent methyltransferase